MLRNLVMTLVIIVAAVAAAKWLSNSPAPEGGSAPHEAPDADFPRGPRHGRLLEDGPFGLEMTIFESGVPPEFHVYPYFQDRPLDPKEIVLRVELGRTGSVVDRIEFLPEDEYLRGDQVIYEPHSFDVTVTAEHQGRRYRWQYENYEGRVEIPAALAADAGIGTGLAGPATIKETIVLTGRVAIDPNAISLVRPRFPGVVRSVHAQMGDTVRKGDRLLSIQSNESLQDYQVHAPIDGQVIKRNAQAGEATSGEPLFTIVDLSRVWVLLDVFTRDVGRIEPGQTVHLETLDGFRTEGTIDWLDPLSDHASQSVQARVPVANPEGGLRPGQFVRAEVRVAERAVALAVRRSGIQQFRDFQVVFARFGDIYEVRMLELGVGDDAWVEVLGGLAPGAEYVTENSFLIKADIEKSGASHDH